MANRTITTMKHRAFTSHVENKTHYKFNASAEERIYIEVGQYSPGQKGLDNKKITYSKWVDSDEYDVIIFGNAEVLYYFDVDTLRQIAIEKKKEGKIKDYDKNLSRGFVMEAEEAYIKCDMCVKTRKMEL